MEGKREGKKRGRKGEGEREEERERKKEGTKGRVREEGGERGRVRRKGPLRKDRMGSAQAIVNGGEKIMNKVTGGKGGEAVRAGVIKKLILEGMRYRASKSVLNQFQIVERGRGMIGITFLLHNKLPKLKSNPIAKNNGGGSTREAENHFEGRNGVRGKLL